MKLSDLVAKYLATLNDKEREEWSSTDRKISEVKLKGFLEYASRQGYSDAELERWRGSL